jgi:hypothetical protein
MLLTLLERLLSIRVSWLRVLALSAFLVFFLADNIFWFATFSKPEASQAILITGEQKEVLNWLARKAVPPDLVVTADPLLGFLVSTYTRVRSWAGSGVSTPDFDLRTRESQQAFQDGVILPAWESMHMFYIQRSGQDTLWKPPQNCSDVFQNAKYDVWECLARSTSNMQTETTTF